MVQEARSEPVGRARRPRDRKAQIVNAAGDLFYRRGYHNVGTGEIASSVGITAGALYRHFASKQDMLAEALIDAFDHALDLVDQESPTDLATLIDGLAATAGQRRHLGVLWNREARHLDDARRGRMRERFFGFVNEFQANLDVVRPELGPGDAALLSWCALAVLTSPSYHRTELSRDGIVDLLNRMAFAVCTTTLPAHVPASGATPAGATGLAPSSRRESILAATTRLFYIRGYQAVSMDDIGAAVGMTNAGIYKYFDSKAELLAATIARASEPLQLGLTRALASARTPAEGLSNALDAYIDFALVHHDLVGILVSEVTNLPDDQRHSVRRSQHDYVEEWVRLLTGARPELAEVTARFVVHAALTVVNDAVRTADLMRRHGLGEDLRLVAQRILAVDLSSPSTLPRQRSEPPLTSGTAHTG
ncbi:MAG: regulatory protein TetR [Marmoricola sp.]|nr:regulatory protein TetR [Marmoricola sp.]